MLSGVKGHKEWTMPAAEHAHIYKHLDDTMSNLHSLQRWISALVTC